MKQYHFHYSYDKHDFLCFVVFPNDNKFVEFRCFSFSFPINNFKCYKHNFNTPSGVESKGYPENIYWHYSPLL